MQRELAEWFKIKYGKSINQSTVSRNLKKFKSSPTSRHQQDGPSSLESSPIIKRDRKSNSSRSPPHKKLQIHRQPQHVPSGVSLPPTPPPRENRSQFDNALHDFLLNFKKLKPSASTAECNHELKAEAQRLYANLRPLPSLERLDGHGPVFDDAWVSNWKQGRRILGSPLAFSCHDISGASASSHKQTAPGTDRTCSEETEPRSPVSTVSSVDNMSLELAPMKPNGQYPSSNHPAESPEKSRKRKIDELRKDIEKRDQRIQHETRKKEHSLKKLEKLEKAILQ